MDIREQIAIDRQNRKDYPQAGIATCLTCYRSFADIHPSARCPFEYWHDDPPARIDARMRTRIREGAI